MFGVARRKINFMAVNHAEWRFICAPESSGVATKSPRTRSRPGIPRHHVEEEQLVGWVLGPYKPFRVRRSTPRTFSSRLFHPASSVYSFVCTPNTREHTHIYTPRRVELPRARQPRGDMVFPAAFEAASATGCKKIHEDTFARTSSTPFFFLSKMIEELKCNKKRKREKNK